MSLRPLSLALTVVLALAARASALPKDGRNTDPSEKKCPAGQHRVSLPDSPRKCWPDAPVCPGGTHSEVTPVWGHPWQCEPNQAGSVCPAGMHGVLMQGVWGRPFECVADCSKSAASCNPCPKGAHNVGDPAHPKCALDNACPSGLNCTGCPPGQHNVVAHEWGQPVKCVANAPAGNTALNGGTGGGGGGDAAPSGGAKPNTGGVVCMHGMHAVHKPGQRPHCEP